MRLLVISVGKVRESYLNAGIKDFLTRLRPYVSVEYIEGLEQKTQPRSSPAQITSALEKEGQRILSCIREGDYVVALDSRGESMTSEVLAHRIGELMNQGKSRVVFVVGGSHGLAPDILKRAQAVLSFSLLTFPHQLAVLMLLEQIYRSFKIIRGEPYHK
ncbi:MAG: 23S rRNA (pseudouridine(1915)-N(3))-methyltransferase RlmH [Syntrophomonadaceae bacterium]|jgi:23S rRNA (pseudouridine1915-N3)-methyltransferase|nr:23S rRNA (pseudouridine(1915)-N(3))-methyltransferase RlmH [Syntrophomonadaceae bacterium]